MRLAISLWTSRAQISLFLLITRRYEKPSTVFTSNETFFHWNDAFGDVTIVSVILDRVLHHRTVINIKGESCRLKEARADAAKGRYMDGYDKKQRTGFSAMRDAHMKQFVSPDRAKPTSQVSAAINDPKRVWHTGANLLDLLDGLCTAKVFHGPMFGTTAEIYDGNGEMIAGYRDSCGWFDVPAKDETRFQYESNHIYREAYKAAEAEIADAKQTAAPAVSGDTSASFDVKA